MDPTTSWMFEVDQRLDREGFHLLRVLYLKTLPLAKLTDGITLPHDLYEEPVKITTPMAVSSNHKNKQECKKLSPQHSLALFVHRLRILVPQSSSAEIRDHFRAKDCLDAFRESGIICPPLDDGELSKESRMLECLVKCYVNMTQRRRLALKKALGQNVGLNAVNVNVFDIFSDLFIKRESQNRCEQAVAIFVGSLKQARSQPGAYIELERHLCTHNIAHDTIPIPEGEIIPESDEELVQEIMPAIMPVVEEEIRPLLDERDQKREVKARKITRKRLSICLCFCFPIILGLFLFAIAMAIMSTHVADERYTVVDASVGQMHCPLPCPAGEPAPIYIGNYNTFWHKSVTISQETDDYLYFPLDIVFYLVPAENYKIHKKVYRYNNSDMPVLVLDQFYAMKESSIHISLSVSSNDTIPRCFNVTICQDLGKYQTDKEACVSDICYTVKPNSSAVFDAYFRVEDDGYYFITTKPTHANLHLNFFASDIFLHYLNSSDWSGMKPALTCYESETAGVTKTLVSNDSFASMLEAKEYSIVATFSSNGNGQFGKIKVTKEYRSLVYVVPAMAAACLMLLGLVFIFCMCLCYRIIKRVIHRKIRGNELKQQI